MKTMSFASSRDFRAWLAENHDQSEGVLLRIYKKGARVASVTYAEALDQALCYGWIDGQKHPGDKQFWLQKFTPRRPNSGWSKKNTENAERLIKSGEMTQAGLKEVRAAKSDARWQAAYDPFGSAAVPDDFLKARETRRRRRSLIRSTRPICIALFIGCRRRRSLKPEISGCRRSSKSWRAARSFTEFLAADCRPDIDLGRKIGNQATIRWSGINPSWARRR